MSNENKTSNFQHRLKDYKDAIDQRISEYSADIASQTARQFGKYPSVVAESYLEFLGRGGKRIRGALVMAGYELLGGSDRAMITNAAMALEMIHAYILAIDDIQDRSMLRRGKPTVHEHLTAFHKREGFRGDAEHTGLSLALNAALQGVHAAQVILTELQVSDVQKLKAIAIINQTMITTVHGQTTDIVNELAQNISYEDVQHALEWKTAHYTILNPLCVGMVLASADCRDTDAIRDYALNTGLAFQITDDIIGIFGEDSQTGKSKLDDVREGKRTLLTEYALGHATVADKEFLRSCLGNPNLQVEEFDRCREIILSSGAFANAQQLAQKYIKDASMALDNCPKDWDPAITTFLRQLTTALIDRTT